MSNGSLWRANRSDDSRLPSDSVGLFAYFGDRTLARGGAVVGVIRQFLQSRSNSWRRMAMHQGLKHLINDAQMIVSDKLLLQIHKILIHCVQAPREKLA